MSSVAARAVAAVGLVLPLSLAACESRDGRGTDGRARTGAEPGAGTWKTWVVASPSEHQVPPPPTGALARAEEQELHELARRRTPAIREAVANWDKNPVMKPWVDLNIELVSAGVKDPPLASRGYGLTSVAIYDAVVATWHWKHAYDRPAPTGIDQLAQPGPDPSYPSEHAAIAGAASRVLAYLFPDRPAARFEELAENAAMSRLWAGVNFRSDVDEGLRLGREIGDAVVAYAKADGADRKWDGRRPPGIGHGPAHWEPPPGTVTPPTQPLAGTWKTWVLSAGHQLRPPPPPAYGTQPFLAACREVMEIQAGLSPEQADTAKFWAAGQGTALPAGVWNQVAFTYVEAARYNTPHAARAFALLNVALADAGVAVWDAKFTYWSPRPVNAIRDEGLDPGWAPLLPTPPFPSYVSGHAGYSGAAAEVLAYLFPPAAGDFRAKAEEAALSRLYGGIHFRIDNDAGLRMGRGVGRLVVDRAKADGSAR